MDLCIHFQLLNIFYCKWIEFFYLQLHISGTTEIRKSLCWTNETRKAINYNYNWMQENQEIIIILLSIIFKYFSGLPVICKTTMSL